MDVVPIQPEDYPRAARVLTRAFFDDPVICYVQPDAARRARGLPWLHQRYVAVIAAVGTARMTANCEGVALWLPPASLGQIALGPQLRAGLWQVPFRLGLNRLPQLLRAQNDTDVRRRQEVTQPHWVLDVLGVDPDQQGKGVGSALVRDMTAQADAQGLPCHVITHKESNVAIYERLGFRLLQEKCTLPGGPTTYSLCRPAGG